VRKSDESLERSFMLELLFALPLLVKAAILGIVEGLTEFLPISSTGHLILVGSLLGWSGEKAKLFDVAIQSGAMIAIIIYYREKLMDVVAGITYHRPSQKFVLNLFIAFLPLAILGLSFSKQIKYYLFKPVPVAIAFIVGGFIILWVERWQAKVRSKQLIDNIDQLTPLDALKLGLAQAVALIPGTSRSGATIIGGMCFGLSRKVATEFSFFLAVPTLIGAGVYEMYKNRHLLSLADIPLFSVGLIFAFISAFACVHWLIRFVASNTFVAFAWYRIGFGLLILMTAYTGVLKWE
jgi:undecaprenyl-diphosphatase